MVNILAFVNEPPWHIKAVKGLAVLGALVLVEESHSLARLDAVLPGTLTCAHMTALDTLRFPLSFLQSRLPDIQHLDVLEAEQQWWKTEGVAVSDAIDRAAKIPQVDLSLGVLNKSYSTVENQNNSAGQVNNVVATCGVGVTQFGPAGTIFPGSGSSPCTRFIAIYVDPLTPSGLPFLQNAAAVFQGL